jgi:hypothetical protein
MERLRADEAEFLSLALAPPELPGGYYHDYICPEHGVELRFDAHASREHRCPADGRRFEGARFDAAWRWFANHHLAEGALRLAALYRAEGGAGRLEGVRAILTGYAGRYAAYAAQPRPGENPGIATFTTLDESVWSVSLAWAYSLIAPELGSAERAAIAGRLLVPAAEHLARRHYRRIHNFSCWHNAAIATLAAVAERPGLLASAVDDPESGQRRQMREGLLPDGLWWEGSMSYHLYAAWAMLASALAAPELFEEPLLALALRAPIDCALPDGGLPATHDCWHFTSLLGESCHGVPPSAAFYEIAAARWNDPAFHAVLARTYRGRPRDGLHALLFGPDEIRDEAWPERRSFVMPDSGLAFLRPGGGLDLMVKFGPPGGWHGHPDKLALTGSAGPWRFSSDLGTPGYGVESLETWYRQTLSHNTVLLDGESQPPAAGRLLRARLDRAPHLVEAAAEWEDGVRLRRLVAACPEYFVDLFDVKCERERRIEWIWHNAGGSPPDGGVAFRHLRGAAASAPFEWHDGARGLRLWLAPAEDEAVFTGRAPGNPPSAERGFLLRRRAAARAAFAAVFHPFEGAPSIRVEWRGPLAFTVVLPDRVDEWDLAAGPLYRST